MKIGTDGVMVGAWCSLPENGTVWDLGTGTGLIALMAAQRCGCRIVGVELDRDAAQEAMANAAASPWSDRVTILQGDATILADGLERPDAIVSNPPYFATTLRSPDMRRAEARHTTTLSPEVLIAIAAHRLAACGTLSFIAPAEQLDEIEAAACYHRLNMQRVCTVYSRQGKEPLRVMVQMGRELTPIERTTLHIRNENGEYSEEYRRLTQDFYTHLK